MRMVLIWLVAMASLVAGGTDKPTFTDVQIDKPYKEMFVSNPVLMGTTGAKIIKTLDGNFLLVGLGSRVLKDNSPKELLEAEQVCKIKALREVVGTTQGVQIASVQKSEDRIVVVIDKDGPKVKTVSDYLEVTEAKVQGLAKGMTVLGRWKSGDGKTLYVAVGLVCDRKGNPVEEKEK